MLEKTTAGTQIQNILSELDQALTARNIDGALELFTDECYWRDLLSFTWNIKTLESKDEIRDMLAERLDDVSPTGWALADEEFANQANNITEGFIRFDSAIASGYGYIRLKDGLIWTLLTTMQALKGYEFSRPFGAKHGERQGEPNWAEERESELAELGVTNQPYVLIIGAGQNGLSLGARLRQLNVPTLIVEKNERVGDNWRERYRTLCLHNPVWENPFPYMEFPDNWPIFTPKDKYAGWLEAYAKLMELNIWGSTEAKRANYDQDSQTWTVVVERNGEEITLQPKQLVLATGSEGSRPHIPDIPGQNVFKGVQKHSAEYSGTESMKDKKVVVIGSGTSAHDICGDLALNGAHVTMVQRSSAYIVKSESFMKYVLGPIFSAEAVAAGVTAEKADLLNASIPLARFFDFAKPAVDKIREVDADFYRALEDAGFLLDFGPGGSGLFGKALTRTFNYYIEIGTSQLIIDGRVKMASGSEVRELTENSVILEDGREIQADAVIYGTGFELMENWVSDLISPEVAEKVGPVGGFGSGMPKDPGPWEGEFRNLFKPTRQEGLWITAGLIAFARFYSHFLALQLKARMEGIPTPVYGLRETHRSE
jgi:putative flavoprotein involved in K+ transport